MVHIFGEFSFTLDKMTISLTLGLVTMANPCLGLDSFLVLITRILLVGGLIQTALIFWCCLSFCGTTVRVQAITQIKIQRVLFGIFIFAGVSFFICEVLALCAWIGFRRLKISLPTLEQPMLLSLDSYSSDEEQNMARLYGARCTPDPFLFVSSQLFYHGRLNDNWKESKAVKEKSMELFVLAALGKGEAPPRRYPSMGCSIKWQN